MVLVTGGTGLVGSHLLFQLLNKGETVRAIHRKSSNLDQVLNVFSYYSDSPEVLFRKISWICADINDIPSLEIAFENVTHVYHSAALISFDPDDFVLLEKINVQGTANIVNLCLAHKVQKLCYVSSISAIGKNLDKKMVDEDNEWTSAYSNVYGVSKHFAEMEVWRGAQEGLATTIINPGIILGPGFWYGGSGALFRICAKGLKYYFPGGSGFITVNDVARMMIALMKSPIKNERYIAIDKNLSYKELFSNIAREFGKPIPKRGLKFWQLEIIWRLDWLNHRLSKKRRKITRDTVVSMKYPEIYNNKKVVETLDFEFELMAQTVYFTCNKFKEAYPALFA